jgi:hypothetical protein
MKAARRNALLAAAVVLAAVALHARALGHGFVNWDDDRFITDNPLFAGGWWSYARAAVTRVQFESYQPLWLLSYLPDRWFWPHRATGFHAIGLALFGLVAFLLFRLARRHAARGAATAAVLLFVVHPLCVEPVDWISDRKNLLAAAFFIGVLLVEDRRNVDEIRPSATGLMLFVAAFLSKTAALCLPPLLWCWLIWMRRTSARVASLRAAPYAFLGLIPSVFLVTIWREHRLMNERPVAAPIDVLSTLATYARRIAWPNDLAAMYPVEMPVPVASAAIVVAIAVIVILAWRRLPAPARFALIGLPVALLPVANIVSLNLRFADRYAFLALAILVPPGAIGLEALFRGGKLLRIVAVGGVSAAALSLAAVTVRLTDTWASSRALWAHATSVQPNAYMARIKYAETWIELHDWSGAAREYLAAVRQLPLNAYGYAGLLFVHASRAEEQGRIPPGTAGRWLAQFNAAQYRATTFDSFMQSVPHSTCAQCADVLLMMRLRRWPKPDPVLLLTARAALDEGKPDAALVILDAAIDKDSPQWRALSGEIDRVTQGAR